MGGFGAVPGNREEGALGALAAEVLLPWGLVIDRSGGAWAGTCSCF